MQKKVNIKSLVMVLYSAFVMTAFICVFMPMSIKRMGLILLLFFPIAYFIFNKLISFIESKNYFIRANRENSNSIKSFIGFSFFSFIILLIWYIAYYPGAFSPDCMDQLGQAITGNYNDWHPVWHTFLFYKIPLLLTGKIPCIVLFQIVLFSMVLGYAAEMVWEFMGFKQAIIMLGMILLNPYTGRIVLNPFKDVAFSMSALFCTVFAMKVYYSEKKDLSFIEIILITFAAVNTAIFRKNGVLYIIPLMLFLFCNIDLKNSFMIIVLSVLLFWCIKFPFYQLLNVPEQPLDIVEITGVSLTVIGNVAKETPDRMDEKVSEYAYSLGSQDIWDKYYECGNFYSVKYLKSINLAYVREKGLWEVIRIMLRCFQLSPGASFKAFFSLTDIVYGIRNGLEGGLEYSLVGNQYGLEYAGCRKIAEILTSYESFINHTLLRLFITHGTLIFIILLMMISKFEFRSCILGSKISLFFPIVIYVFGTMFLLLGPDMRYFYITYLVCPLFVLFGFYDKQDSK